MNKLFDVLAVFNQQFHNDDESRKEKRNQKMKSQIKNREQIEQKEL